MDRWCKRVRSLLSWPYHLRSGEKGCAKRMQLCQFGLWITPLCMFDSKYLFFFRRYTRQRSMNKKPLYESRTEIMFGYILYMVLAIPHRKCIFTSRSGSYTVTCPNLQKLTNGRSVKGWFYHQNKCNNDKNLSHSNIHSIITLNNLCC